MAVTADSVVVDLVARVDKAEADIKRLGGTFENVSRKVVTAANDVERSSARAANASRNLGRQISDIGVGLAGGQSPFLIIAQQAPQVADALADTEGKAASLARFFAGPWGAALLAAASIAGVFIGKLVEGDGATKKQKDSMQKLNEAIAEFQRLNGEAASSETIKIRLLELGTKAIVAQEIATRNKIKADLEAAKAARDLQFAQDRKGNLAAPLAAGGVTSLERQLAAQDKKIAEAERNARTAAGNASRLRQQANGAGADPIAATAAKVAEANQKYELAVFALERKLRRGAISQEQFDAATLRAVRARDAVVNADQNDRKQAAAERKAAASERKEAAEQKRDAERFKAAFGQLEKAVSPLDAANAEYRKLLETIDAAEKQGVISAAKAGEYRIAADLKRIVDSTAGSDRDSLNDILNRPGGIGDASKRFEQDTNRKADERFKAENEVDRLLMLKREEDVQSLASLYERAFSGGVGSIWETFKEEGLKAIALVLARLTIAKLGGGSLSFLSGGGSIGTSIANAIFGGPGRASGGYMAPYSVSRVNEQSPGGVELLRMGSQGGEVISLGRAQAAKGGVTTIVNAPQFNLRGAVITRELYADMQRIANQSSTRAAAAMGQQVMKAVPGRVQQFGSDGT